MTQCNTSSYVYRLTILDNDGQCKYTKSCITQQQLQSKASTESGGNSSGSGVGDSDKFDWARGSGAHGEAGNRTERVCADNYFKVNTTIIFHYNFIVWILLVLKIISSEYVCV